jgi:hypothetical protein
MTHPNELKFTIDVALQDDIEQAKLVLDLECALAAAAVARTAIAVARTSNSTIVRFTRTVTEAEIKYLACQSAATPARAAQLQLAYALVDDVGPHARPFIKKMLSFGGVVRNLDKLIEAMPRPRDLVTDDRRTDQAI